MVTKRENSLVDCFSDLKDPRVERTKKHKLIDIIIISICGVIAGANGFETIEVFADMHQEWLKKFLELPHGIPSHDTFERVFARINPKEFQKRFSEWTKILASTFANEIIAVDGQTLRRSHDHSNQKSTIHVVSAWAARAGLVLGQVKVDEKSNEITAIPEVLRLLDLRGCIVTTDAMGCQQAIAKQIIEQDADYLFGLKKNQGNTLEAVQEHFDLDSSKPTQNFTENDKGHGRVETRTYTIDSAQNVLDLKFWPGIKSVVKVNSIREMKNKTTNDMRFYISSLAPDSPRISTAVRGHWGVENGLHYVMDETFDQDRCRLRTDNSAENFTVLRHIALNLLKQAPTMKGIKSINMKRFRAGMDTQYLEKILKTQNYAI